MNTNHRIAKINKAGVTCDCGVVSKDRAGHAAHKAPTSSTAARVDGVYPVVIGSGRSVHAVHHDINTVTVCGKRTKAESGNMIVKPLDTAVDCRLCLR